MKIPLQPPLIFQQNPSSYPVKCWSEPPLYLALSPIFKMLHPHKNHRGGKHCLAIVPLNLNLSTESSLPPLEVYLAAVSMETWFQDCCISCHPPIYRLATLHVIGQMLESWQNWLELREKIMVTLADLLQHVESVYLIISGWGLRAGHVYLNLNFQQNFP